MELIKLYYVFVVVSLLLLQCLEEGSGQQTSFELPVQLVGFPFIIVAVRMTNFFKKLSYALSPATYRSRNRRGVPVDNTLEAYDAEEVEKYIVAEFGNTACVFERTCAQYAKRAQTRPRPQLDWSHVFSEYKKASDKDKEFFLLSVFLGDILGSPQLCQELGRKRSCVRTEANKKGYLLYI